MFKKVLLLLCLLRRDRKEFVNRIVQYFEPKTDHYPDSAAEYKIVHWEKALAGLQDFVRPDIERILQEDALKSIEKEIEYRSTDLLSRDRPFELTMNADILLAKTCYLACRLLKPRTVLETGVAYGCNTSFILQALEKNGIGKLISIDLPPLGNQADKFVGFYVPETLKSRWHLHRGNSRSLLPEILSRSVKPSLFIHDSLHTYRNMKFEFGTVVGKLNLPAMIISDDIERNPAFFEVVGETNPTFHAYVKSEKKPGLFGVCFYAKTD